MTNYSTIEPYWNETFSNTSITIDDSKKTSFYSQSDILLPENENSTNILSSVKKKFEDSLTAKLILNILELENFESSDDFLAPNVNTINDAFVFACRLPNIKKSTNSLCS